MVSSPGASHVVGTFVLTDHHGRQVTEADYRGRFMLIFFGFSHCQVVCPRVLAKLSAVLERLGEDAERVQPLYITVDPERDTPEVLKNYLRAYHHGFVGLTGTRDEIDRIKANYRVFAERRARSDPGAYDVPHTSLTYLMDTEGAYRTHFAETADEIAIVRRLEEELQNTQHSHTAP